jgi:hypothetical protein
MRREFHLPEEDEVCLDAMGIKWETIRSSGEWLLLHECAFPSGYNHRNGSVAVQIPGNYPIAQLDMAYFFPALARSDGKGLRQTQVFQQIDGKAWQRWSRHYTWVPGEHNVCTHIILIRNWLEVAVNGN